MNITIKAPARSGKSTVAQAVAAVLSSQGARVYLPDTPAAGNYYGPGNPGGPSPLAGLAITIHEVVER